MLNPKHISPVAYLLLITLLMLTLAACGGETDGEIVPADLNETPAVSVAETTPLIEDPASTEPTSAPAPVAGAVPYTLRMEAEEVALDPACLETSTGFELRSAPLPDAGLEQGIEYSFCAVGAPDGAEVVFTLSSPNGGEQVFHSTSIDEGGTGVAALALRLTAADSAGDYILTADYNGESTSLALPVIAATKPFIALSQQLEDNPSLIRASVGGLPANGLARFALYRLDAATDAEGAYAEGTYLIATTLQADDVGRADIELDVSDLPAGPYLMLLAPAELKLDDPAILDMVEMDRLTVTANIARTSAPATAAGGPGIAPQPASGEGELPESIRVDIADASLPTCELAAEPALQLWPSDGEIGDWWYGCAVGFGGDQTLNLVVTMANDRQSAWDLDTNASGAASFRWYSSPDEGVGEYNVDVTSAGGQKANLSWEIDGATRPHLLVFPHDVRTEVGSVLNLSGFPADAEIEMGLYRLDEQGQALQVKQWTSEVNGNGALQQPFEQSFALEDGEYVLVAQGGPLFDFPGINVPASAVDFFGYNTFLSERYDSYMLNLGRSTGQQAVVVATPTPGATAEATTTTDEIPPKAVTLTEDASAKPTCPDVASDGSAACVLPATVPRGTFVYIPMIGYDPGTKLRVFVTPPGGGRVELPATADAEGYADVHWYGLNDEALGDYNVAIRGGGSPIDGKFTITQPAQPSVIAQPRSPDAGTPVIISGAGFESGENLILARYLSQGVTDGVVNFTLDNSERIKAGGIGGFQTTYRTGSGQDGNLYLVNVYRPSSAEPVAQAVYQVGQPLYLRYPFGWAGDAQSE
ncbi:MAG: hypothetical protein J5I90_11675 [Caldilineales bacterium]|nr:hypothetical protein [Caldilineales bacterium]